MDELFRKFCIVEWNDLKNKILRIWKALKKTLKMIVLFDKLKDSKSFILQERPNTAKINSAKINSAIINDSKVLLFFCLISNFN